MRKEEKLIEFMLALVIILMILAIASIATDLVLKIKNDGQNINRVLIGINK